MFFSSLVNKNKILELKTEVNILKIQLKERDATIAHYKKMVTDDAKRASFSVDWDVMRVFSIERNPSESMPKTILGHMVSEPIFNTDAHGNVFTIGEKDVVSEWTLYCSAETHEALVNEFNDWKANTK